MASIEVTVELSDEELAALDNAVSNGAFSSRASAVERALRGLLHQRSSEEEVAASYRRAYRDVPEDERFAGVGLRLLADRLRTERDG